jgi:trehalose 6-phosphate phosphatase
MVVELRPAGATKAQAVAAFLEEAPFAGRMPIFIGDDLTDEPAFELVNRLEGVSVIVGAERPSAARARLEDVAAVRSWLDELQSGPEAALQRFPAAEPPGARSWSQL